jgi:hypothetical protein
MRRKDRVLHRERVRGMEINHMQRPNDSIYYVCGNVKTASAAAMRQYLTTGKCASKHFEGNYILVA